jgi:hypothetical protein
MFVQFLIPIFTYFPTYNLTLLQSYFTVVLFPSHHTIILSFDRVVLLCLLFYSLSSLPSYGLTFIPFYYPILLLLYIFSLRVIYPSRVESYFPILPL